MAAKASNQELIGNWKIGLFQQGETCRRWKKMGCGWPAKYEKPVWTSKSTIPIDVWFFEQPCWCFFDIDLEWAEKCWVLELATEGASILCKLDCSWMGNVLRITWSVERIGRNVENFRHIDESSGYFRVMLLDQWRGQDMKINGPWNREYALDLRYNYCVNDLLMKFEAGRMSQHGRPAVKKSGRLVDQRWKHQWFSNFRGHCEHAHPSEACRFPCSQEGWWAPAKSVAYLVMLNSIWQKLVVQPSKAVHEHFDKRMEYSGLSLRGVLAW